MFPNRPQTHNCNIWTKATSSQRKKRVAPFGKQICPRNFGRCDWHITSAFSAKEALEALENKNFVSVITDLRMPGMDGLELLDEIRARYSNRVQVIVMTMSDDLEDLIGALEGGASDFVLKPFKKEVLVEVLEHTLARIDRWNQTLNLLMSKQDSD